MYLKALVGVSGPQGTRFEVAFEGDQKESTHVGGHGRVQRNGISVLKR